MHVKITYVLDYAVIPEVIHIDVPEILIENLQNLHLDPILKHIFIVFNFTFPLLFLAQRYMILRHYWFRITAPVTASELI